MTDEADTPATPVTVKEADMVVGVLYRTKAGMVRWLDGSTYWELDPATGVVVALSARNTCLPPMSADAVEALDLLDLGEAEEEEEEEEDENGS